jgi:hypothetical protein
MSRLRCNVNIRFLRHGVTIESHFADSLETLIEEQLV